MEIVGQGWACQMMRRRRMKEEAEEVALLKRSSNALCLVMTKVSEICNIQAYSLTSFLAREKQASQKKHDLYLLV